MLNQSYSGLDCDLKIHPALANADWCVGDAPQRWDVSFTDRLWLTLRRWFARDTGEARPVLRVASSIETKRRVAA